MSRNKQSRNKQEEVTKETLRRRLEEETETFLKAGGKVQQIPSGVSGQDMAKPGPKHIRLSKPTG